MNRNTKLLFLAGGTAAIVVVACSSSTSTPPDDPEACAKLASGCHSYSSESALGKECHDIGHDGVLSKCQARLTECVAACPPREGGTTHDDAAADAVADVTTDVAQDAAPDPACTTYCTCLADTCATFAGYPFAAPGSCATACAAQSADERKCWPKFCEDAKASTSNKQHLCEHAWGSLGLDECP